MNTKKIVITGGPSTGKTAIVNNINALGFSCMQEISREITLEARKNGVTQLFLSNPLHFSDLLLKGRIKQFITAEQTNTEFVFLDRGIPDIVAYLNGANIAYEENYTKSCVDNTYDMVFILPPWEKIYVMDNERYEDFDEAKRIHDLLVEAYTTYGYNPISVPVGSVKERTNFILKTLNIS